MAADKHAAVFALVSLEMQERLEYILDKSGRGWRMVRRFDGSRTNWYPIKVLVPTGSDTGGGDTVTTFGPVLVETTEAEMAGAGLEDHPPKALVSRARRVLDVLPPVEGRSVGWTMNWVREWQAQTTTAAGNHQVHARGRMRKPSATPRKAPEKAPALALRSTAGKAFEYPEIVGNRVLRPNGEHYRVRKVGRYTDIEVLRRMREGGTHMLSVGQPGCGKTALMEAAFGGSIITVMGTEDIEAADLVGGYTEGTDGRWHWIDGPLPIAMENGWVIYIDEIGVIRQKQISSLYSVMDGRNELRITQNPERGVVRAQPGFAVAASTNIESAEVRMTDAAMNRFGFRIKVPTNYAMLQEEFGIPAWLTGAAENLEKRRIANELPWAPQTRDLLLWRSNAETLGGDLRAELEALGSMVNGAPVEAQAKVAEVLSKARGKKVEALVLV